jgi:hypothetical protein
VTIPRYSREDMADAVQEMVGCDGGQRNAIVPTNLLRKWAATMSEAANRTPTHAELVGMIEAERREP